MSGKTKKQSINSNIIRTKKLILLQDWLCHYLKMDIVYNDLRKMFDASPECQVNSVMEKIFLSYTDLVAEKVGDKDNWLDWYLWENDAGEKGFEAKASNWKMNKRIKSLEDLLDLIENKSDNKSK